MIRWVRRIGLTFFLLWCLLPIYWLINTSAQASVDTTAIPPRWFPSADWSAYGAALANPVLRDGLIHSLLVALGTTVLAIACGTLAAFALTHLSQSRPRQYEFWVLTSRMAPPIAVALPLFLMYRTLGLQDSLIGLILAHFVIVIGIVTWILIEAFRALPKELLESALVDGCRYGRAFTHILLPLTRSGIVGAASIAFLFSWNDFFLALILADSDAVTAPLAVYQAIGFQDIDLGLLSATAVIVLIPTAVIISLFQRQLIAGLTMGAVKG